MVAKTQLTLSTAPGRWFDITRGAIGLGTEDIWVCPTYTSDATDIAGLAQGAFKGDAGIVDNTGESGTHAIDISGAGAVDLADINHEPFDGTVVDMSVSAWVYVHDTSTTRTIASKFDHNDRSFALLVLGDNTVRGDIYNGSANYRRRATTSTIALNQWVHVVAHLRPGSNNVAIWFDGVQQTMGSYSIGGTPPSVINGGSPPVVIGATISGAGPTYSNQFDGLIDDLRIFSHAVTGAERVHLASGRGVEGPPPTFQSAWGANATQIAGCLA